MGHARAHARAKDYTKTRITRAPTNPVFSVLGKRHPRRLPFHRAPRRRHIPLAFLQLPLCFFPCAVVPRASRGRGLRLAWPNIRRRGCPWRARGIFGRLDRPSSGTPGLIRHPGAVSLPQSSAGRRQWQDRPVAYVRTGVCPCGHMNRPAICRSSNQREAGSIRSDFDPGRPDAPSRQRGNHKKDTRHWSSITTPTRVVSYYCSCRFWKSSSFFI
jgi:hypothetical protein